MLMLTKLNTTAVCLFVLAALSLSTHAADLTWNTTATGDFGDNANWTPHYDPVPADDLTIAQGTAQSATEISTDQGGSINVGGSGTLELTDTDSNGRLIVGLNSAGALTAGHIISADIVHLGHFAGSTGVAIVESGGTLTASSRIIVGNAGAGTMTVRGTVNSGHGYIGYASAASNSVDVVGGAWNLSGTLRVGGDSANKSAGNGAISIRNGGSVTADMAIVGNYAGSNGAVDVADGSLTVGSLLVGVNGTGSLNLSAASALTVSEQWQLGGNGQLTAEPGTTVLMDGNASFRNNQQDASAVADLANIHMKVGGDGSYGFYEVAGEDLGFVEAGWDNNFAMGTLELLGTGETGAGLEGKLQLIGTFDNVPGSGDEALYLDTLILGEGSTLALGSYHLYVRAIIDNGGEILPGTGTMTVVPEPATLWVLSLGGVAMLRRRRKQA